jgi:hypothetical protein
MTITAPLGFERFSPLINPYLVVENQMVPSPQKNAGVSPVTLAAPMSHKHREAGDNEKIVQVNKQNTSHLNTIHLRNKVPFVHTTAETGRGQNVDIWA